MWTKKDQEVISHTISELLIELNYKKAASRKGRNGARKLESHGKVYL